MKSLGFYGCWMLKELFCVRKEEFFSSLALDSDICISLMTLFGGAFDRTDLMSGVIPLMNRCKNNTVLKLIRPTGLKPN